MPAREHKHVALLDPAAVSAVAALEDDPFYRSICAGFAGDQTRRRHALAQYFDYSIQEGTAFGRSLHLPKPAQGVAVWRLPQPAEVQAHAAHTKRLFLQTMLDAEGCANYHRIVDFMSGKAAGLVDHKAWYLSIVAVDPMAQRQGLGRRLLEPTIGEADSVSATCYLETFSARNLPFYERLGFAAEARFTEPTTGADYVVMVRHPGTAKARGTP